MAQRSKSVHKKKPRKTTEIITHYSTNNCFHSTACLLDASMGRTVARRQHYYLSYAPAEQRLSATATGREVRGLLAPHMGVPTRLQPVTT